MGKISEIAAALLGRQKQKNQDKGLAATLEDLMEQRRNVRYLRLKTKLHAASRAGDVKSAFKGRGIEMEEIRSYAFGDDVRDIDWRVTARKNNPYTKIYAEERDREIYVLLDLSASMVFGTRNELKSVTASKIAALLGWMAQENNDRFGAYIFDGEKNWQFKPQQNRAQLLSVFNKIAAVNRDIIERRIEPEGLKKTLNLLVKGLKSRATVFILSDFSSFGEDEKKALAALSKKASVFCLNIYDILEEQAPAPGEYMVVDGTQNLVFDSRPQAFREEYGRFFAEKKMKIRDFCRKFNCRYFEIRTDIPITKQMKII